MRKRLGDEVHERAIWSSVRRRFARMIDPLPDNEFPKTFFSSVTRKTFDTTGVDPAVEFVRSDLDPLGSVTTQVETKVYVEPRLRGAAGRGTARRLPLPHAYRDFERSVKTVGDELKASLGPGSGRRSIERLEVIKEVFYQMTRAYLVGGWRARGGRCRSSWRCATRRAASVVDAIMLEEGTVSVLFSFTRSYFHVDLAHVAKW